MLGNKSRVANVAARSKGCCCVKQGLFLHEARAVVYETRDVVV